MPEGDTVFKLAAAMRPRLEGRRLARVWLRERGEIESLRGARVREVATLGKHLLVVVAPAPPAADVVLHVHLGMRGRWRRAGREARTSGAQLVIATGEDLFTCVRAGTLELLRRGDVRDHPRLSKLGPDLLVEPFPLADVVRRARCRDARNAADLLLDQTIACGLGNAFKSDVLFLEGVHPETPPRALADEKLHDLFACAQRLMSWNRDTGRRVTTRPVTPDAPLARGEPTHWVYGRGGEPCLRCAAPISVTRVGDAARATWMCPSCQGN